MQHLNESITAGERGERAKRESRGPTGRAKTPEVGGGGKSAAKAWGDETVLVAETTHL